jgi:hypothetical protein
MLTNWYAGLFQAIGEPKRLITKGIVLRGEDQCGRDPRDA